MPSGRDRLSTIVFRSDDVQVDVVGTRGVRAQEDAAVAEQLCDRLAALPRLLAEVADDDECAFVREAERDRPAEARSPAGHDRGPSLEPSGHRHSLRPLPCAQRTVDRDE